MDVLILLAGVALAGGALWRFAPRERVETAIDFEPGKLAGGVDAWLAQAEAAVPGITPGTQKRIVWAGTSETQTPLSILYIHGFSATAQEIRPLPDRVAQALGANLVFTRLAGHGQDGAALARVTAGDWMADMAEALAVARAAGRRVIVIATSTGASLSVLALREAMGQGVAGLVMISPNFRVRNPMAAMLTWPFARSWLPRLAPHEQAYETVNPDHARYWTTRYPSVATFPMGAVVQAARHAPHAEIRIPALIVFDTNDKVIDHRATRAVAARWGGPVTLHPVSVGSGDDANRHVIAGDILSPGMTGPLTDAILDWARGL
ncbi:alpha/beta fold hydrolase [Aestuariicoccus sp. KMU-90]|uniref:Alpha/beta fold hydrolase n=2 Tax=Thetidibacter halocola TaxID=2827239 RepID=A0A8J8B8E1_9RHOB|nr:alpha/beta fold hydrolase [Thetidibacter halocola]